MNCLSSPSLYPPLPRMGFCHAPHQGSVIRIVPLSLPSPSPHHFYRRQCTSHSPAFVDPRHMSGAFHALGCAGVHAEAHGTHRTRSNGRSTLVDSDRYGGRYLPRPLCLFTHLSCTCSLTIFLPFDTP
eukprot:Sspe_Gene.24437::Locus_9686_Transcript_3_8_Confidence_0.500_Length_604::g.24437::m.24437